MDTPTKTRESEALGALTAHVQSMDGAVDVLKEEMTLFQRMMYKNQSQHRRAAFFKHLQEVKRSLRDVSVVDIKALVGDVTSVLDQLRLGPDVHHVSWKTLSGDLKAHVDAVLRRLAKLAEVTSRVIRAAQKAYKGLAAQFEMTYFMPFALTMNSILARLSLLLKTLLVWAIEAHGGITLLYLNEVTKSNPLRARITAVQLRGYTISPAAIELANA